MLRLSVKVDVPHEEQAHDGYLREQDTSSAGDHSMAEGVETGASSVCSARNVVAKNDDAAAVFVVWTFWQPELCAVAVVPTRVTSAR